MRTTLIVVEPPRFDDGPGLSKRGKLVHVQTLVSQSSVKRFNTGVSHWLAGPNNVELHAPPIGPFFECSRLEFGIMIHRDGARA